MLLLLLLLLLAAAAATPASAVEQRPNKLTGTRPVFPRNHQRHNQERGNPFTENPQSLSVFAWFGCVVLCMRAWSTLETLEFP